MSPANIFPIIVPRSYFASGKFPANSLDLKHPQLSVTWVDLSGPGSMTYIDPETQRGIGLSTHELHRTAMQNLSKAGSLFTHEKVANGTCLWKAMNHEDGLGSSRLLLLDEIATFFPQGFHLAIPERSCGLVLSKGLPPLQEEECSELVHACFTDGTVQMLDGAFPRSSFELTDA